MAILLNKQKWLDPGRRYWWTKEILRRFAAEDINEYHKFLWSNHILYTSTYEVGLRFGPENMKESRRIFFHVLNEYLIKLGKSPEKDIFSVLEVGCSLGYQLRHMETEMFLAATCLEGIDIDEYAIEKGSEFLKGIKSRVVLKVGCMQDLENIIRNKTYDIVICTGVLMYLDEPAASKVVGSILTHANILAAMSCPALPGVNSVDLKQSIVRESDSAYIHNILSLVNDNSGEVIFSAHETTSDRSGFNIVFAKNKPRNGTENLNSYNHLN